MIPTFLQTLILVRHGEAEHLVNGLTGGWTDLPLTARGQEQSQLTARRLAGLLNGRSIELYCSDLIRARQTAGWIENALGVIGEQVPALRDVNNGVAAGMTRLEAQAIRRPMTDPLMDWIAFEGAESWRTMMARAGGFVETLTTGKDRIAVLVTHRNVISVLVQHWLRLPEALISTTDFEADPCSLAVLAVSDWGGRTVVRLNDTAHLE